MTALREPCTAGIVFAVAVEADAFERLAESRVETRAAGIAIHEGTVTGCRVAWCVGGVGTAAAARAARLLVAGHAPRVLVSAGFAGGLDPTLPRGAIVHPGVSIAEDASRCYRLAAAGAAGGSSATIVTVAEIVATPAAKRDLAARTGAHLVDMETHAVAEVASAAGIPCAAVRVISDDAAQELPREAVVLARRQPALRRLGTAIGAVGRRPSAAVDLWRLYERAVVDARSLATALAERCAAES